MNFFDDIAGENQPHFEAEKMGPWWNGMAAGCRKEKLVLLLWAQPKMATAKNGVENYQANPPVIFYTPYHDRLYSKWSKKHWNAHAKKTSKLLHHASFPESSCRKGNGTDMFLRFFPISIFLSCCLYTPLLLQWQESVGLEFWEPAVPHF